MDVLNVLQVVNLIELAFINSVLTAFNTLFLLLLFDEEMIFGGWLPFVEKYIPKLYKPLGGCSQCFYVWLFLVSYLFMFNQITMNILLFCSAISFGFVVFRKIAN